MTLVDAEWRADNPLPTIGVGSDKEDRGRVLLVGGSRLVPGATLLTGEAVLRAGAGKLQIGTIDAAAMAIGTAFPEAAVIGLEVDGDGEIASAGIDLLRHHAESCDTLVIGPGMSSGDQTADIVAALIAVLDADATLLVDAGAMTALAGRTDILARSGRPGVITPHHGELAALTGANKDDIARDPHGAARVAAGTLGAVVVLKSAVSVIAHPGGDMLTYSSEAPGLGTAGSGDVLAGVIAGLLSRGVAPFSAAAWGVWIHGEAGRLAGVDIGRTGYLARELLRFIPRLVT